jgi:iron complex transport system ATP-binding protein
VSSEPILRVQDVTITAGERELVTRLSIDLIRGQFIAVLGRNGSGKTLTLHTLAGLRPAAAGLVRLGATPLVHLTRRSIARQIGLLAQEAEVQPGVTALQSVLLSRHPHLELWQWESATDERLGQEALRAVGLEGFESRHSETLSGGERQRMAIAALLTQQPDVLLLDEPTNHLDPHHQLAALQLFRTEADSGRTVMATMHDPTLAARFADHVLLLFGDGRWHYGTVSDSLTAPHLSALYTTPITAVPVAGRNVFVLS